MFANNLIFTKNDVDQGCDISNRNCSVIVHVSSFMVVLVRFFIVLSQDDVHQSRHIGNGPLAVLVDVLDTAFLFILKSATYRV